MAGISAFGSPPSPLMSTVLVLTLNGRSMGHEDVGLTRMIAPHAGGLKALRIGAYNLGNAGLPIIAASSAFTSLGELDLSSTGDYASYLHAHVIQADGVEALASRPGLARLRTRSRPEHAPRRHPTGAGGARGAGARRRPFSPRFAASPLPFRLPSCANRAYFQR